MAARVWPGVLACEGEPMSAGGLGRIGTRRAAFQPRTEPNARLFTHPGPWTAVREGVHTERQL